MTRNHGWRLFALCLAISNAATLWAMGTWQEATPDNTERRICISSQPIKNGVTNELQMTEEICTEFKKECPTVADFLKNH